MKLCKHKFKVMKVQTDRGMMPLTICTKCGQSRNEIESELWGDPKTQHWTNAPVYTQLKSLLADEPLRPAIGRQRCMVAPDGCYPPGTWKAFLRRLNRKIAPTGLMFDYSGFDDVDYVFDLVVVGNPPLSAYLT